MNSVHENKGNKRLRGDTSIQEPEISCNVCICEDLKKENEKLKQELHDSQNKNLEASHNLLLCKQSKESLNHEMNNVLKISVEKDKKIKNLEKEVLR